MGLKKGEKGFYKGSTPKELREYIKMFPELEERIDAWLEDYRYNYVKETWHKIGNSI